MTHKQKLLIQKAKPFKEGLEFYGIYIINSGKEYNGFWGINDFRNIIVIGETMNGKLYKIEGSQYDVLRIDNSFDISLNFEINKFNDCLHMYIGRPYFIKCQENSISTLILEVIKNE